MEQVELERFEVEVDYERLERINRCLIPEREMELDEGLALGK